MKTVRVNTAHPYEVMIGEGLLARAGGYLKEATGARRALIVSDDNVFPLYGASVAKSLEEAGIRSESFVFRHGESAKTLKTYAEILEYLCEKHFSRSDAVLALGGGVTGDLSGFAASTYQRGMDFVQLPTSLLADVDSSVGGKTAVNLRGGKNQAGSFYQPRLVLADTGALGTLPRAEYANGAAEVIKCALLSGGELFESVAAVPIENNYAEIIARCVALKRDIVEKDEFDTGERAKLNLGHTFGHAVEKLSGYTVPHGRAVAMGLAAITRAAVRRGFCDENVYTSLKRLLDKYELPAKIDYPPEEIARACLSDKKADAAGIKLIVPRAVGNCEIVRVPAEELPEWVKAGIE